MSEMQNRTGSYPNDPLYVGQGEYISGYNIGSNQQKVYGSAVNCVVSGGIQQVYGGGMVGGTQIADKQTPPPDDYIDFIFSSAMNPDASASLNFINAGGIDSGITLNTANAVIYSGGSSLNAYVSGGVFTASAGSYVSNLGVASSGQIAGDAFLHGRVQNVSADMGGGLILNGPTASNVVINNGGIVVFWNDIKNVSNLVIASGGEFNTVVNNDLTITNGVNHNRLDGHSAFTLSGGVASNYYVAGFCSPDVGSGQRMVNTLVSGGEVTVSNGGITSGTILKGGAASSFHNGTVASKASREHISGGSSFNALIQDLGQQYIACGLVASARVEAGGLQAVWYDSAVDSLGVGILANATHVASGGSQIVRDHGIASNTVISSGGYQGIFTGGSAIGTIVSSGGVQEIDYGAIVHNTTVRAGGTITINTPEYTLSDLHLEGICVVELGTLENLNLVAGASQVLTGGTAINTVVNSGARQLVSAGVGINTTVKAGGEQFVTDDGITHGDAVGTRVESGGRQIVRSSYASDTTVAKGASQIVSDAVTSRGAIAGAQIISSGGSDYFSVLEAGAVQTIYKGGLSFSTVVKSGAVQRVSGGVVNNADIKAGGRQILYSGTELFNAQILGSGARQLVSGGAVWAQTIEAKGSQIIYKGGVDSDAQIMGGTQILSGGKSVSAYVSSGGSQIVRKGGAASAAFICDAVQTVYAGGSGLGDTILAQGRQILSGGLAKNTLVAGGTQQILKGGIASRTTVQQDVNMSRAGIQCVSSGGKSIAAAITSGGQQIVRKGGLASAAVVSDSGRMLVSSGGIGRKATVKMGGSQIVSKGGVASGTILSAGAFMRVSSGGIGRSTNVRQDGHQFILKGGIDSKATVAGSQYISSGGKSLAATVNSRGQQLIYKGALASAAILNKGGKQTVYAGGIARTVNVKAGAVLNIAKGGIASRATLAGSAIVLGVLNGLTANAKGILDLRAGGVVSGANMKKSSGLRLTGAVSMRGTTRLDGVTAKASKNAVITLGGSLNLSAGVKLASTTVKASARTITVTGLDNRIGTLVTNNKSTLVFDISKLSAKGTGIMLSQDKNRAQAAAFSIKTKNGQQFGVYELGKNLGVKTAITVSEAGKKLGVLQANGQALTKNGVKYTVTSKSSLLNLMVSGVMGTLRKGTAKGGKLTGTANCDIFYGGSKNDQIAAGGGRDVAVYDKKAWGKDVITSTSGTMTIYMAGLKASDVTVTKKSKDMIITRKGVSGQSITVRNWNAATHNIVYGGTMGQFTKYVNAARPTAKQKSLAFNEVWKKSGMLA